MRDHSFGVIPLQQDEHGLKVLMVQHRLGHWGFPKGHAEPKENDKETAARELQEETGLTILGWVNDVSFCERYQFLRNRMLITKEVIYFPAFVQGTYTLQREEVATAEWLSSDRLESYASFPEMKVLCRSVHEWLTAAHIGH